MIEQHQTIFIEPFLANVAVSRGSGASNLLSADPREVWYDNGGADTVFLDIDLGSARLVDTISLINVTSQPACQWGIRSGVANYDTDHKLGFTNIQRPSEDDMPTMGMAFYWTPIAFMARFVRIYIQHIPPFTSIGRVVIGQSWKPSMPHEFGSGRPWQDSGNRTRMENGGLAVMRGDLMSGYAASFGDLDPADLRRIGGMLRRHLTTEPLLLVENPVVAYAEQIHWGTFTDIERYDRRDTSKSRWNIKFEDWA